MINDQETYTAVMNNMKEGKKNSQIVQLKLTNGENVIAIRSSIGIGSTGRTIWVNPVKMNFVPSMDGTTSIILNAWFVTSDHYYHCEIKDEHIISQLVVGRGMAEYYRSVNDSYLPEEESPPARRDPEELVTTIVEKMTPADDTNGGTKYSDPKIRDKIASAIKEGRFVRYSSNTAGIMTSH